MPTYEYECSECGWVKEMWAYRPSEAPATRDMWCIDCHHYITFQRKIGPGSPPIFKGSGFYVNDYAKEKPHVPNDD